MGAQRDFLQTSVCQQKYAWKHVLLWEQWNEYDNTDKNIVNWIKLFIKPVDQVTLQDKSVKILYF